MSKKLSPEKVKQAVKQGYAKIAQKQSSSCCGGNDCAQNVSKNIGYTNEEIGSVPDGANLGLGCGNPTALASIKEGETVLDLGSGPGFDCFLAANKVGAKGKVIDVDMTPEMIQKAKENAKKGNYRNVEFRLGEIEKLPVADNSVDLIISNCVINLSPDKKKVFQEAFRVLRPGGRFMISDMVLLKELPDSIKKSIEAYVGCLGGAILKDEYIKTIEQAGFQDIKIDGETSFPIEYMLNDPTAKALIANLNTPIDTIKALSDTILSIRISGAKPH